jgi:hypothetical protein
MKKILILEDRIKRQESFLNDSHLPSDFFTRYADFVDNLEGNHYDDFKQKLSNASEYDFLKAYCCIIVHRSAFTKEIINRIFAFCNKNKIDLVYFSGGISSTNLQENSNYSFLTINSKHFYSSNLVLFLDELKNNSEINLGILAFGKQYDLNILLSFSHKLSFIDAIILLGNECLIEEFVEKYGINNESLKIILKEKLDWFDENNTTALETLSIFDNVKEVVEKLITEKLIFND